ncbi:MAG: VCBS repeat-containing protein [Polyangiales bacterium]
MIVGLVTASVACSEDATGNVAGDAARDVTRDVVTYDRTVSDAPPIDATVWDARVDATRDVQYGDWWPDAYQIPDPPTTRPDVFVDFPSCEPSSYVDCACGDGGAGYQVCSDRRVWMRCICDGAVAPATGLPPRLIAPLSNLRVTSQRPTLRWELPSGITRARVELCEDVMCARGIAHAEVTGASWRSPTPLRPGVVFWRVLGLRDDGSTAWTSATWEFGVRHRDTPVDTAWGSFKDFDGDGYDDVLVRVAWRDSGTGYQGWALYRGRPDGLELAHAGWTDDPAGAVILTCTDASFNMNSVAISDVNRDGLADAVIECDSGARVYLGTRSGEVLRFAGTGDMEISDGFELVDLDGDGDDDIFTIGPYPYQASYLVNEAGRFNTPIEVRTDRSLGARDVPPSLGDIDGDGYGDGIIYRTSPEVFYGSPSLNFTRRSLGPTVIGTVWSDVQVAFFGADLNADGRMDLVSNVLMEHRAFNRQLVLTRAERMVAADCEFDTERMLSRPGDLDGDGWPEFATSVYCRRPATSAAGGTLVRLFSAGSSSASLASTWMRTTEEPAQAGIPGDLNGDGFDDLVIASGTHLRIVYGAERTLMDGQEYTLPRAAALEAVRHTTF